MGHGLPHDTPLDGEPLGQEVLDFIEAAVVAVAITWQVC